jgi:hypothetical protein
MLKYNSELQQETVELLEDFYKEDTERLLTLLEWDKHALSFK